jgi:hypothetical protein
MIAAHMNVLDVSDKCLLTIKYSCGAPLDHVLYNILWCLVSRIFIGIDLSQVSVLRVVFKNLRVDIPSLSRRLKVHCVIFGLHQFFISKTHLRFFVILFKSHWITLWITTFLRLNWDILKPNRLIH